MEGGTSGPAAVAGKPDESPLYLQAAHLDEPKMPPGKPKIPSSELDRIRAWISGGLVDKTANAIIAKAPAAPGGLVKATRLPRPGAITALAVSPVAPLVAVAGRKQILLYRLPGREPLGAVAFPEGDVHVLRFSCDGSILLAGGGIGAQSGKVVGFRTDSWQRAFGVGDEADVVLAADVTADHSKVVLGGPGRVVKIFATADGKLLHAFRKPTDWVLVAGFSPEGLLVAAGDRFGGLYVWETNSGKEFQELRGHTKAVTGLAWRADSNAFASASEDGSVRIWDMHTGSTLERWQAHESGVLAIDYHRNGLLATGGRDQRVKVWSDAGKLCADLGPAGDIVLRIGFVAEGNAVASGDWAGMVRIWPLGHGTAIQLARPLAPPQVVAVAVPVPAPQRRAFVVVPVPQSELAGAREIARKAARDLEAAQKALAAATDVVRAAEESAARAKAVVETLAALVESRAAEARNAQDALRRLESQSKATGSARP